MNIHDTMFAQLVPAQRWVGIQEQEDEVNGIATTTEVMELPHGCLVRTTVHSPAGFLRAAHVSTALVFVPHVRLDKLPAGHVAFAHKP